MKHQILRVHDGGSVDFVESLGRPVFVETYEEYLALISVDCLHHPKAASYRMVLTVGMTDREDLVHESSDLLQSRDLRGRHDFVG